MERFSKGDQACALATAAAHEFNDELTVILSSVAVLINQLEPDDPARAQVLNVQDAAWRCARKTSGLLRFGLKRGARVARASLDGLIGED